MTPFVKILDIPIFNQDLDSAIQMVMSEDSHSNKLISATGAHGLVLAKKDANFRNVLNSFYLNLPDGMPCVWIGRLRGHQNMKRCYGPDFFMELIKATATTKTRHFLCGGVSGVADQLKEVCKVEFNNTNVVGTLCPPHLPVEDFDYPAIADEINRCSPDIVWIGLGAPKQEQFAVKLAAFTKAKFIITVGAAFDFHTGRVRQAPKWVQRIGMEWFFRLLIEPRRLWRRYLEAVPAFIYYSFIELLRRT